MDFIFNELSLSRKPQSNSQADSWLKNFFNCAIEISKRRRTQIFIISSIPFQQILLTSTYAFSYWLNKQTDIEYQRMIRSMISKKPLLQIYPCYYYNNTDAKGLGIAHYKKTWSLSFPQKKWGYTIKLTKEEFDIHENVIKSSVTIQNISCRKHVDFYFPMRFFEHHPKHDNRRLNLNDGESTLLYDIPHEQKKVQEFLDSAIGGINSSSVKLFNFDKSKNKYIEFQKHFANKYHGYHIDNENRVPYEIRKNLKNSS